MTLEEAKLLPDGLYWARFNDPNFMGGITTVKKNKYIFSITGLMFAWNVWEFTKYVERVIKAEVPAEWQHEQI
jgi:hypothetical protein